MYHVQYTVVTEKEINKPSEGCRDCYIHKGNFKRGVDTNNIIKTHLRIF